MLFLTQILPLLLLAIINIVAEPNCLYDCSLSGYHVTHLSVSGNCKTKKANYCQVKVNYNYHSRRYDVQFDTSYVRSYSRFIYILPSNYLSYSATFSCSDNDKCALDFADKKLLDLANRTYNSIVVSRELAPLLTEARPAGSVLRCYDGETCLGDGMCQIEYDTKANSQKTRGCNTPYPSVPARVSAYDSGSYAVIDVECDRTSCNSPETMQKVKEILFRHNLTDANGRINSGLSFFASMMLIIVMLVFSGIFN